MLTNKLNRVNSELLFLTIYWTNTHAHAHYILHTAHCILHMVVTILESPGKSWNLDKIHHFVLECPGILLKISHFHFFCKNLVKRLKLVITSFVISNSEILIPCFVMYLYCLIYFCFYFRLWDVSKYHYTNHSITPVYIKDRLKSYLHAICF